MKNFEFPRKSTVFRRTERARLLEPFQLLWRRSEQ